MLPWRPKEGDGGGGGIGRVRGRWEGEDKSRE
jgi:hypothetical protein